MTSEPGITHDDNVKRFGHDRCIELTHGLEKASPESGSMIKAGLLIYLIIAGCTATAVSVNFGSIMNIGADSGSSMRPLFLFIYVIVACGVLSCLLSIAIIGVRETIGGFLGKYYHRIQNCVTESGLDDERMLGVFLVKNPPFSYRMLNHNKMVGPNNFCVITSHRGLILTVHHRSHAASLDLADRKIEITDEFDYSSPVEFYPIEGRTGIYGQFISARFGVIRNGDTEPEIWDFMLKDGNSWFLFEEILRRRSNFEKHKPVHS